MGNGKSIITSQEKLMKNIQIHNPNPLKIPAT